jgi:hypothetical protein
VRAQAFLSPLNTVASTKAFPSLDQTAQGLGQGLLEHVGIDARQVTSHGEGMSDVFMNASSDQHVCGCTFSYVDLTGRQNTTDVFLSIVVPLKSYF